ncbi:MAG: hypothetical protein RLZZ458_2000 [Planctomycetota bacterium]
MKSLDLVGDFCGLVCAGVRTDTGGVFVALVTERLLVVRNSPFLSVKRGG